MGGLVVATCAICSTGAKSSLYTYSSFRAGNSFKNDLRRVTPLATLKVGLVGSFPVDKGSADLLIEDSKLSTDPKCQPWSACWSMKRYL